MRSGSIITATERARARNYTHRSRFPDQVHFREIDPTLPDGKIDHPHALIQFFEGAPSYDAVWEPILASLSSPRPVRLGRAGL